MTDKTSSTIGIVLNPRKEHVVSSLKEIETWKHSTKSNVNFLLCGYDSPFIKEISNSFQLASEEEILRESDAIITLGGDGSILRIMHAINSSEIPVLGVNLGGLGFLAETSPEMLIAHLEAYLRGDCVIEKRSLLQCRVEVESDSFFALNDIVIDKAGFSRVIEIVTKIDGNLLNSYIADAMILSTPTGSTGYSLSAGGPITIPHTNVFIINPICPHSLTNRPVVVSDQSEISINVFTEHKEVNVFRDGQMINSFPSGSMFTVTKAPFTAKLIRMKEHAFYDTLRNKLHWGEDFRDKKRWSYNDNK